MKEPTYPEHVKLEAISDKSQCIYDFLEWAAERGYQLAKWTEGERRGSQELFYIRESRMDLLAAFFEIDLKKIEAEKRAMLDYMRKLEARNYTTPKEGAQ